MGWILPKGGIPELAHAISRNLYGKPPKELTKPEQDIVVAWISGRAPVTEAEVRRDLLKDWVASNEEAGATFEKKSGGPPPPSSTTQTRSVSSSALGVRLSSASSTTKPQRSPTPFAAESNATITMWEGALRVDDNAAFRALAKKATMPSGSGASTSLREVKFIITGASTSSPQIAFLNTNAYEMHHAFAKGALGAKDSLEEFNARAYFAADRDVVCGSVVAVEGETEKFALQFLPTDPMTAPLIALSSSLVQDRAPFLRDQLVFHPTGQGQLDVANSVTAKALGLPVVETPALLGDVPFAPLNTGVGFGVLRILDGSEPRPATAKDVVVFTKLPNDVAHTAGVITVDPQTPLSHVNLKAKQNQTPNAYIKDATDLADIKRLEGSVVRFEVTAEGYDIRAATAAEAADHMEKLRPATSTTPPKNTQTKTPAPLSTLAHAQLDAFGAKSVNAAELQKILPPENRVDGVGVPFDFYDAFMKQSGLDTAIQTLMAEPRFQNDETYRNNALKKFRRTVRDTPIPAALQQRIDDVEKSFPPGTVLRLRSSTNNEDLDGFNGAGLYASRTWDPSAPAEQRGPQKSSFGDVMKDVWSSLFSFRAVEERTFHKIDHAATAMGVLVHPSYGDKESIAGVAISKNIYDPKGGGFYVNVQPGDDGVTSPGKGARPEELLLRKDWRSGSFVAHTLQKSSQSNSSQPLLTPKQQQELASLLEKIETHFRGVYGKQADPAFAMDVEFVVDNDRIRVVQARPWVDG